jgi:trigger factor
MQVTETSTDGLKREFKIVVDASDVEDRMTARLEHLRNTANLPGFRPGKVPVSLLRKRYGDSVMGEILEETVSTSSQAAIVEKELRPALQPDIKIEEFEEGKDLVFTMTMEVMPTIEPADFSKISVEKFVADPGDAQTEQAMQSLAEAQKTFGSAPKDHVVAVGDVLKINFIGSVDGVEFPGGKGEDVNLEIGSGSFIPGFEEQLVGAKVGGHVAVNVTFPEDYSAPDLAGKAAVFEVDVTEINVSSAADIDDQLGERLGLKDLKGVREAIKTQLERDFAAISKRRVKREVLDALAEMHDFEIPSGLVEAEFKQIWQQVEEAKNRGDEEPADTGKSEDELKDQYREIAGRRVQLGMLLAEVGRKNNIEATVDEVDKAMADHASRFPGQEQEVISFYRGNPQAKEQLKGPILEDKVVDFILEIAKVTEKKISAEELLADPDVKVTEQPAPAKKAKAKAKAKPKAKGKAADKKPAKAKPKAKSEKKSEK